jgi:hypothetical protein
MNRRIRDPYVRWCERRTGGHLTVSRLLDCAFVLCALNVHHGYKIHSSLKMDNVVVEMRGPWERGQIT